MLTCDCYLVSIRFTQENVTIVLSVTPSNFLGGQNHPLCICVYQLCAEAELDRPKIRNWREADERGTWNSLAICSVNGIQ